MQVKWRARNLKPATVPLQHLLAKKNLSTLPYSEQKLWLGDIEGSSGWRTRMPFGASLAMAQFKSSPGNIGRQCFLKWKKTLEESE